MKKNLTICLLLLMVPPILQAQTIAEAIKTRIETSPIVSFIQAEKIEHWLTYYYLNPTPDKVPLMLNHLINLGMFVEKPKRSPFPMVEFFSQIFKQNPEKIKVWMDQVDLSSPCTKIALFQAVWWSNTQQGDAYLSSLLSSSDPETVKSIKKIKAEGQRPDLLNEKVLEMRHVECASIRLDMLWHAFFATGDARYVNKIIDAFAENQRFLELELTPIDHPVEITGRIVVSKSANWSVGSNAQQHKAVLKICEDRMKKASGLEKEALRKIVMRAQIKRSKKKD